MGTDAASFLYPPEGSELSFNFRDRINATWEPNYRNLTNCVLTLWWWIQPGHGNLAYKKGQPCIGSALVDLNFENQAARAQFNLNYDFSNGTNGITYSAKFDTSYNETVEPVTWSPTTSNSALPNGTTAQTTVVSFLLTASTSPNSGPTISSLASSTASSRHSKDARIIGSTLGVLLALALFVLAACLVCMRKSRSLIRVLQEKDMARGSTREGTVVDDGTPIGTPIAPLEYLRELPVQDGPRELSGGGGGGRHELSESRQ